MVPRGNRTVVGTTRRQRRNCRNGKGFAHIERIAEVVAPVPKEPETSPIAGENAYRYAFVRNAWVGEHRVSMAYDSVRQRTLIAGINLGATPAIDAFEWRYFVDDPTCALGPPL